MYSKILILHFPPVIAQKPIVCILTKQFDLIFNILGADISHRREGHMVLELSGTKPNFKKGVQFLKDQGINISYPDQAIYKDEEICTHCGACTAVCPTGALSIHRPEMKVEFNNELCSVCELCILTCPTKAMGLFAKNSEDLVV